MDAVVNVERELDSNGDLPYSLPLELTVEDKEVIRELWQRTEGPQRDEYALAALRLGVLTLRQARGVIDSQELKLAGERLLADVKAALSDHHTTVKGTLSATMQNYFDPKSGQFSERVDRLICKDGDLATLLDRKITAVDSEMCRELSKHIGEGSPIFRLLSPNESEGVLAALRNCVSEQLTFQRNTVLKEFSLDNKEGALSRLLGELCESNGDLQDQLKGKIDELLKQFSFDDEESALSRMSRTVNQTSEAVSRHLTLDDENSALSRLRRELFSVLKGQGEEAKKFQEDVRVTLERFEVRRSERARSTGHGIDFQSLVFEVIQTEAQHLGDIASFVGSTPGKIPPRCTVGDVLVELGCDSCAPSSRIVAEAKEEKNYKFAEARSEIAKARENRDADAGLFVFSSKTAPTGIEPLARHGTDVFVVWNSEDPLSDMYLRLGLSVARAMCIQKATKRENESADFKEMDRALLEISKQIEELDKVRKWAEAIKGNSEDILGRVRISTEKLKKQVETLTERLSDLRQLATASVA